MDRSADGPATVRQHPHPRPDDGQGVQRGPPCMEGIEPAEGVRSRPAVPVDLRRSDAERIHGDTYRGRDAGSDHEPVAGRMRRAGSPALLG